MTTLPRDESGAPVEALPIGTTQTAAFTATSAAISNAVGTDTRVVRVVATQACHVAVRAAPTATTSNMYLPADTVVLIGITPGQKLAAIRSAVDGTLFVTE